MKKRYETMLNRMNKDASDFCVFTFTAHTCHLFENMTTETFSL